MFFLQKIHIDEIASMVCLIHNCLLFKHLVLLMLSMSMVLVMVFLMFMLKKFAMLELLIIVLLMFILELSIMLVLLMVMTNPLVFLILVMWWGLLSMPLDANVVIQGNSFNLVLNSSYKKINCWWWRHFLGWSDWYVWSSWASMTIEVGTSSTSATFWNYFSCQFL